MIPLHDHCSAGWAFIDFFFISFYYFCLPISICSCFSTKAICLTSYKLYYWGRHTVTRKVKLEFNLAVASQPRCIAGLSYDSGHRMVLVNGNHHHKEASPTMLARVNNCVHKCSFYVNKWFSMFDYSYVFGGFFRLMNCCKHHPAPYVHKYVAFSTYLHYLTLYWGSVTIIVTIFDAMQKWAWTIQEVLIKAKITVWMPFFPLFFFLSFTVTISPLLKLKQMCESEKEEYSGRTGENRKNGVTLPFIFFNTNILLCLCACDAWCHVTFTYTALLPWLSKSPWSCQFSEPATIVSTSILLQFSRNIRLQASTRMTNLCTLHPAFSEPPGEGGWAPFVLWIQMMSRKTGWLSAVNLNKNHRGCLFFFSNQLVYHLVRRHI